MLFRLLILFCVGAAAVGEPFESEQPKITSPEEMFRAISKSHVDANLPAEDKLHSILERDLKRYAANRFPESEDEAPQYYILGMGQVGIGWPKLYMVVQFGVVQDPERTGLLSAIAKDQERFEVEHFVTYAEIKADPDAARRVFPSVVFQWLQQVDKRE